MFPDTGSGAPRDPRSGVHKLLQRPSNGRQQTNPIQIRVKTPNIKAPNKNKIHLPIFEPEQFLFVAIH